VTRECDPGCPVTTTSGNAVMDGAVIDRVVGAVPAPVLHAMVTARLKEAGAP
jgi:hypothetical protein